MKKYSINLSWLYPSLMSTYSDRGNIMVLKERAERRGVEVIINKVEHDSSKTSFEKSDLIIGGGAQDRQQEIAMNDLKKEKGEVLFRLLESGVPGLFTCGSPQLLGKYYEPGIGQRIDGLNFYDFHTIHPGLNTYRCIGNIAIKITGIKIEHSKSEYLVGFENHGGRTYLSKNVTPLGEVICGFGNNGEDKTEGAVYKNAIATYLHGPVLPKNPHLADYLLGLALEKKYQKKIQLEALDDSLEWRAHFYILNKLIKR